MSPLDTSPEPAVSCPAPYFPKPDQAENPQTISAEIADQRLIRALSFISNHYAEQLTLARLSKEAGVSKYHFIKLFTQATGQTPLAFVAAIRLAEARRLLCTTEMNISEVAVACGFLRATHFASAFSSRYGLSPSKLRAQDWT